MIWKTRLTEMMETKYPVIMGAFAGIGRAKFAAPFSNAGGLGIVTALNFKTPTLFKKELSRMHDLTDKPFGINISVIPPQVRGGQSMKRKTQEEYLGYVEVALDEGVKVFTTSAYQADFIGKRIHEAGCYWFHKSATISHAQSAEKAGADAVTIVGLEGTGFKNPLTQTTLVNLTLGRRMLSVPIIAAGGIGDARGFLGALAMGADAVCFGTAIMMTEECPSMNKLKEKWMSADIFSEEYYQKIYHLQLRDTSVPSMAIGHLNKIISMKDFLDGIMEEAESILRKWGFEGEEFKTTN
jgi:NAD(P)H-dependent flavin oxidoreductase YrpB (nitropropane dioxygenase family)